MPKLSLPSFETLLRQFGEVLKRFPLEILFALLGTAAAIAASMPDNEEFEDLSIKLILCGNLGLIFSLSATTFAASLRSRSQLPLWLLRLLVIGFVLVYYFTLPEYLLPSVAYRFGMLSAAGHLLVAVAPFWEKGNIGSFWHYNKALFLRILLSALYSVVLFAGLTIAMLALDELFGVDIPEHRYFQLWCVIAGLFNTSMFLSGIPKQALQTEQHYPKGLKIFTQYVLIPLVSIYILILLAYELKILVAWDLPRGWVSNLVIAFAIFGVLSLLLVFPVRHSSENKWIVWYGKVFHWILLPLTALLFLAIGTRLADYGFTEERFIVLATGIWLVFIALYALFFREENIKIIPASLLIFTLLTLVLAIPVSINSQQQRMLRIFEKNQLLGQQPDGSIDILKATSEPGWEDRRELTGIVNYLLRNHGKKALIDYFPSIPDRWQKSYYMRAYADTLLANVGISTVYGSAAQGTDGIYFNISGQNGFLALDDFDYYLEFKPYVNNGMQKLAKHSIEEHLDKGAYQAFLVIDDRDTLRFELKPIIAKLAGQCIQQGGGHLNVPLSTTAVEVENSKYKARIFLQTLSGKARPDGTLISDYPVHYTTRYLLKVKN